MSSFNFPSSGGGATGTRGPTGLTGPTGPSAGPQGATGLTSPTGIQGTTGAQGITGAQAVTGIQGQTGVRGTTGLAGQAGFHYTFNSSSAGTPGSGQIEFSATLLGDLDGTVYISNTSADGQSLAEFIQGLGTGANYLYNLTDYLGNMITFSASSVSTGGSFVTIVAPFVSYVGSPFTNNRDIYLSIGPSGTGTTGFQGVTGAQAATGIQGQTGALGNTGAQGNTGFQGPTGFQGQTGLVGQTGIQGSTGQGIQGIQGQTGLGGPTGPAAGPQGVTGLIGPTGIVGQTGVKGVTGITGATTFGAQIVNYAFSGCTVSLMVSGATSDVNNITCGFASNFIITFGSVSGTAVLLSATIHVAAGINTGTNFEIVYPEASGQTALATSQLPNCVLYASTGNTDGVSSWLVSNTSGTMTAQRLLLTSALEYYFKIVF